MSEGRRAPLPPGADPFELFREVNRDADEVSAVCNFPERFRIPAGGVHGGILAAAFDDIMYYALVSFAGKGVTVRLTVNYRSPVPVCTDVLLRSRLLDRDGRKVLVQARLEVGVDGKEKASCEATGVFMLSAERGADQARTRASGSAHR